MKNHTMSRKKSTVTKIVHCLAGVCLLASLSVQAGDFSMQDMQGKTHRLADYRGHWVLVNFWGTWCPPCLNEIPDLNSLHDAHKELVVLGVAMQSGTQKKITDFVAAHNMRYPVVMGTRTLADEIRIVANQPDEIEVLPTTYLFDPKGKLVFEQEGEVTRKSIEKVMRVN